MLSLADWYWFYAPLLVEWEKERRIGGSLDEVLKLTAWEEELIPKRTAREDEPTRRESFKTLDLDLEEETRIPESRIPPTESFRTPTRLWYAVYFFTRTPTEYCELRATVPSVYSITRREHLDTLKKAVHRICREIAEESIRTETPLLWGDDGERLPDGSAQYERIERRMRDKYPETAEIFDAAALPPCTDETCKETVNIDTSDWLTFTRAAKRLMDGSTGLVTTLAAAKGKITRACDKDELMHEGKGRARRICPDSVDAYAKRLRDADLDSDDEKIKRARGDRNSRT